MAPRTVGWAAILGPEKAKGIADTRLQVGTGPVQFARLPEALQLDILGPAKLAAYQDGKLKLSDVAGFRKDPKWGPVGFERPLKDILGEKEVARYLDPVRREAAMKAAMTRATAGGREGRPVGTGGGGGPGDGERRRQMRLVQLEGMGDSAFASEMREHQAATWGQQGLSGHYQRHAADVARWVEREMTEQEYAAFAKDIMARPDKVFTGLTTEEHLEYNFVRSREDRRAIMLTVSRRGLVRTMYPTPIERWLKRHPEQVEVTDRVRRLDLGL